MEIIDNQLRDNTPPETRFTLDRLLAAGHSLEDARRLIGCVVSTEIYSVLTRRRTFDELRMWPHSSVCRSCRGMKRRLALDFIAKELDVAPHAVDRANAQKVSYIGPPVSRT